MGSQIGLVVVGAVRRSPLCSTPQALAPEAVDASWCVLEITCNQRLDAVTDSVAVSELVLVRSCAKDCMDCWKAEALEDARCIRCTENAPG